MTSRFFVSAILASSVFAVAVPAKADSFNFSTGGPTNAMASASRPNSAGKTEIESADDFVTTATQTSITSATFTGLLSGVVTTPTVQNVIVEIYRVFTEQLYCPAVGQCRHEGELAIRRGFRLARRLSRKPQLYYGDLGSHFYSFEFCSSRAASTPKPGQTTGGDGSITGQEVLFTVNFTTPINLPPDHLLLRAPSAGERRRVLLAVW